MAFGSGVLKALGIAGLLFALTSFGPLTERAQARVFVSLGFGVPLFLGPAYPPPVYAPPAYYPPPAYVPPAYAPPPATYVPPQSYAAPPAAAAPQQECREYRTTSLIGGQPQQIVGRACQQPDGSWRIVQ